MALADQDLIAAVAALQEFEGNKTQAAQAMGLSRSAFRDRLHRAAILGFCGSEPPVPGFGIKQISVQEAEDGTIKNTWTKQARIGDAFEVPDGHTIRASRPSRTPTAI